MSDYEHYKGKLKELPRTEEMAKQICEELGYEKDDDETFLECLYGNSYKDGYVVTENKLYKVLSIKEIDFPDVASSHKNQDGTISFEVNYYNGGCSFDDAIELAINNMENKDE